MDGDRHVFKLTSAVSTAADCTVVYALVEALMNSNSQNALLLKNR